MWTVDIRAYLEFLGDALIDFLKCQLHFQTQVTASVLLRTTRTAETSESVAAEDVAEHREDVIHVHAGTTEAAEASEATTHIGTVESKLVILLSGLRIVQYIIGLGSLLELLFSLFVTRITIGVVLDGYLTIRFLISSSVAPLATPSTS